MKKEKEHGNLKRRIYDEKFKDLTEEEKEILKLFGLFYCRNMSRYKVARALLILKDTIKELKK